jgi:hypothetical protein
MNMEPRDQPPPDVLEELGVQEDLDVLDEPDVPDEVKSEIEERIDAWRDSELDRESLDDAKP